MASRTKRDELRRNKSAEREKELAHGIKAGDAVTVGGDMHTVLAVSGNCLTTSAVGGCGIENVHASKAARLCETIDQNGWRIRVTVPED